MHLYAGEVYYILISDTGDAKTANMVSCRLIIVQQYLMFHEVDTICIQKAMPIHMGQQP